MTSDVGAPTIREQLIEGGLGHVRREGVGDLTVRTLAKVSGRSTMCVYTKFGARSALVTAIYEAGGSELLAALDRSSPSALLTSLRHFARDEHGLWDLLLGTPPAISGVEKQAHVGLLAALVDAHVEAADREAGADTDVATEVDAATAARLRLEVATALGLVAVGLVDDDDAWAALLARTPATSSG